MACRHQVDKDEAWINRKRIAEEQRKSRIFNAKQRQIGLDVDALNRQVHEKRLARAREEECERQFAEEAKRQRDLAELFEKQKVEEIRERDKKIEEYRKSAQKPEYRKEFDLYDPNQKKKERPPRISADDPCPLSSVQKLDGEDIDSKERQKKQKEMVRDLLLQQMQEKRMQNFKKDKEDHDWDNMLLEHDCYAVQMTREEARRQRKAVEDLKELNKALATEKRDSDRRQEIIEDIEKKKDIEFNLESDLLTEDPNVARSALGPNRVVPDRWKGMTQVALDKYREEQLQQMLDKKRRKEKEQHENAQWDEQLINQENVLLLLEEEQKRNQLKFDKELTCENERLADDQRRQRDFLENCVYINCVDQDYYDQFNRSSR
ncbi:RIB43A-like with coiled-coils protein 2 [Araneus ventricosus]|uniref:RIB43A-like with coiled-coils protein 2 n=1 Tax=Araneus ventricosus TaxID=182803 RepID=A0A4Y2HTJ9_ARAVE|nr:RIB43A-like with coiled-coils protein 2 [Araneus ventricosus]